MHERLKEFNETDEIVAEFETDESSKVGVFCMTCDSVIYETENEGYVVEMVLSQVAQSHAEAYFDEHIVVIRRKDPSFARKIQMNDVGEA